MNFDFSTLNAVDWALILIIGGSALAGLRSGFVRVVIGLAAGITGLILGAWFYETVAQYLTPYIDSVQMREGVGFMAVFLAVAIFGGLVSRLLAAIFKWAGLSWMDRLLGGAVGLARGLAIIVAMVTPLMAFVQPLPNIIEDSKLLPYAINVSHVAVAAAPRELRERFSAQYDRLKKVWSDNMRNLPGRPKMPPVEPKKESY